MVRWIITNPQPKPFHEQGRMTQLSEKFNRSVSMLSWCHNEEELIGGFLDRAVKLLEDTVVDWELIVVDDGSTDQTAEILSQYAQNEPRIRILTNEKNINVGLSCRRAVESAGKDFLFWQTVDWSYDLKNLRIFLELLNHFDVVQGIRPTPIRLLSYIPLLRSIYRVKSRSDNFRKAIVSLSNYYLLRILFGASFHDFQNITFYPTALVQSLELRGKTSFVNPEMLIKVYRAGANVIEVPISFIPRQKGIAKGTKLSSLLRSVADILRSWIRWNFRFREKTEFSRRKRIYRVANPFALSDKVLNLVIPLFKEFR